MLGEFLTFGINGSFVSAEKKFSINVSKANTKFCLSLYLIADHSFLLVNGKEIFKFKATKKILTIQLNFVSEAYLMDLVLVSLEKYL